MSTQINKNQYKIPGGVTGQALVKQSNADFDFNWGSVNGGTGIFGQGQELKIALNQKTATSALKFGNFVIIEGSAYTTDALTGAIISAGISLSGGSYSISEDGLTLYGCAASGGINTSASVTLYTYDINLTLTQTSSWSVGSATTSRGSAIGGSTATQPCPFFVQGGHLVTLGFGVAAGGAFSDAFATDFVISGSSLTSPTDTNVRIYQNSGGQTAYWNYATVYNGEVYIQGAGYVPGFPPTSINASVDKYTYATLVLSSVIDSHSFPFPIATTGATSVGGFIPMGTTIGEWTNSTITESTYNGVSSVVTYYFSIIYNTYTF